MDTVMTEQQQEIGRVGFEDLRICCIVGDLPHEREEEQDIFLDLSFETDFTQVAESDALADTVDYVAVAELCTKVAVEGKFQMIEKLAHELLAALPEAFSIQSASLTIRKPEALSAARFATVSLARNYKRS